ncbi:craniofacial development protein 2-like [Octopus sinensis]|uniref:Craniofacial development protein 2-like n=1 Tax=Octopus sinensis TaxID=2607531 RepID=A0A6P7TSK7_9MOLL|nr:craniofacial development protein 2-like [Octopus sinensis]
MEEKKKIGCDVLGLCETRWKKEASIRWQDGCTVRLGRAEGARSVGGIGFIVSKEWTSRVASCQFISSRIGVLNVNLSEKATLKIVQTYAPTSASDDDEVEEFYRQLDKGLAVKSTYTVVMGDFIAKVGHGRQGEEYVGRFSMGERNEREERLATMAEARRLYIGNSLFGKRERKRWTWISPNSKHRSEIDYILVDKQRILHDVSVVTPFNTGSDHRLMRARVVFDGKKKKMALYLASKGKRVRVYNEVKLQEAIMQENWCQGDGIDDDYNSLIGKLKECLRKAKRVCLREKKGRISEETTKLLEKRKNMKRTIEDHLEYSLLSRVIRQQLKKDFEAYWMEKLLKAAEEKKSLKKCKRDMVLYRSVDIVFQ